MHKTIAKNPLSVFVQDNVDYLRQGIPGQLLAKQRRAGKREHWQARDPQGLRHGHHIVPHLRKQPSLT
jgi:hypothetical protein